MNLKRKNNLIVTEDDKSFKHVLKKNKKYYLFLEFKNFFGYKLI